MIEVTYADDTKQLSAVVLALANSTLERVAYVVPASENWPTGHRHDTVHEIDHSVELLLASGQIVTISWAMRAMTEGLSVQVRSHKADPVGTDLISRQEMSGDAHWAPIRGARLALTGIAVQPAGSVPRDVVWAVRLECEGGRSVVLALGEDAGGRPTYMPDGLVAIFDRTVAQGYHIPNSQMSAWGSGLKDFGELGRLAGEVGLVPDASEPSRALRIDSSGDNTPQPSAESRGRPQARIGGEVPGAAKVAKPVQQRRVAPATAPPAIDAQQKRDRRNGHNAGLL